MKNVIYIILISFAFTSCKAQTIIETKSKDVLIFELKNDNVQLAKYYTKVYHQDNTYKATVEASENREIFNKQNISIITQEWQPFGSKYFNKKYSFIQQKDTMNIDCRCGQERNYYFKNLEFKKGNYELSFEFPEEKIQGNQIPTSKEIQNILFKDSFIKITGDPNTSYKDTYFKDLRFNEIDLNDTLNVKLKKKEAPIF